MNRYITRLLASVTFSLALVTATVVLAGTKVLAQQCPVLTSGLQLPLGITRSDIGNLLVSESGTGNNDGRISIVGLDGHRRTLLADLPSGLNDFNDPSGPAGLFLHGRTLYVAIGVGDAVRMGPAGTPPGTVVKNPDPNSPISPIFSSVLAINFSSSVERRTDGFTLSFEDQQALAAGERVRLTDAGGRRITIELLANFPDFTPNPPPVGNVRASNPFDLVLVRDQNRRDGDDDDNDGEGKRDRCQAELLYVTDGAQNLVWKIDINSRAVSMLAVFPPVPNPLFSPPPLPPPSIGGPVVEAVPTGIAYFDNQLLVTLLRGFPFPAGTSVVEQVDPLTGSHAPFITGLKTAIDVLPIREGGDTDYLVLQHDSFGPPPFPTFSSPGRLLRFETPAGPPSVIADCLIRPTSMALNKKANTLYVTEFAGRIVAIPVAP